MMTDMKKLKPWLMLWATQSLSALGSGMTGFALVIWLYQKSGSALQTALLSICTYAPYVLMSVFAGALSDRWNKKRTMLVCDLIAALCTAAVFALLKANRLEPWHMYLLNALNGLMNTVQQPAGEVAATQLIPRAFYHKTSGLRSFSQSLNSILTPVLAAALLALGGMDAVVAVDLATFALAFAVLWLCIDIPEPPRAAARGVGLIDSAKAGLAWLRRNRLILHLILFLAGINLVASAYNAALPAMLLSRPNGGQAVLGLVNGCVGAATLAGSLIATLLPEPKNRVRAICAALLLSMSTENFLLAFGRTPLVWCVGAVMGWLSIPYMNANMDVVLRGAIPPEMQGRVYACRNTLQFFTIPLGYFLGGLLVDAVFEPFMAEKAAGAAWARLFGLGKGSGAAFLFAVLGVAGVAVCLAFGAVLKKDESVRRI